MFRNLSRLSYLSMGPYFVLQNSNTIHQSPNNKYTLEEIKKHSTKDDIWVTYNNKVYDITKFVDKHPGNKDNIMMAAGSSINPYWNTYRQHYTQEVEDILQKYHIGYIDDTDKNIYDNLIYHNPYSNDPIRCSELRVQKQEPFNSQPTLSKLRESYITPISHWFIRNHHPVPDISNDEYELLLTGKYINEPITFSLKQLKDLPSKTIINTIQCAGNRRQDFVKDEDTEGKVFGLHWDGGAISNGKFKGVLLRDLLYSVDYNIDQLWNEYFQFTGDDLPYDASILTQKAVSKYGDVLIAYEMNEEPIPRDHGGPVRLIVPGYTGAKNVKWLTSINISDEPSHSNWQRGIAYKGFSPNIKSFESLTNQEINNSFTAETLPVQSFITNYKIIDDKKVFIKGIAYSGGGNNIVRVDVSLKLNDKDTQNYQWHTAKLLEGCNQPSYKSWAWTFWEIEIPLPNTNINDLNIVCKATDITYNTQPENSKHIWNLRGLFNNSWHTIKLKQDYK